ncbi:hypothetical protein M758_8G032200 [Ceratodon purpureus]|nr:hypothetical protein M758_8G032200 [Ceratodon purpureus]
MSKEQEGGVGVSDGKKRVKLSKKARMKLKKAAGGGVEVVVMKRKGDGTVGLKGKGRGGGDGDVGETGLKKRIRKKRNKHGIRVAAVAAVVEEGTDGPEGEVVSASPPKPSEGGKRLSYMDKMRAKLSGGQFRMLNEQLYTCKGEEAFELFQKDGSAFQLYHAGYQAQMSHWPKLPVQVVIDWLNAKSSDLVVADFGCGDARLSKAVKNKVYSLDLVACDDTVIACNMAKTPLETGSIDVAVFCLSLMGVDYPSFLKEAHRALKIGGFLLIAEVKSRFDPANDGASPTQFVDALKRLGFILVSQDDKNKMFIMFTFKKQGEKSGKKPINWPDLKPCVYKKR